MNALRERPRAAIAIGAVLLLLVVVAVLIGSALGGGSDAPASPHTDAAASRAVRGQLRTAKSDLHDQAGELATSREETDEWRAKAGKAEKELARQREKQDQDQRAGGRHAPGARHVSQTPTHHRHRGDRHRPGHEGGGSH